MENTHYFKIKSIEIESTGNTRDQGGGLLCQSRGKMVNLFIVHIVIKGFSSDMTQVSMKKRNMPTNSNPLVCKSILTIHL